MLIKVLHRRLSAAISAAGIVAVLAVLSLLVVTGRVPGVGAQTPPANSTPSPAGTSSTGGPAPISPNRGSASSLPPAVASALQDKVLHMALSEYRFQSGSSAPLNGQSVTGDIWERTDASGTVISFQGRYTLSDGSFYQEVIDKGGQGTIVWGTGYAPGTAPLPTTCTSTADGLAGAASGALLPSFVETAALPSKGFRLGPGSAAQPPTTSSPSGATPLRTYSPAAGTQHWVEQQRNPDGSTSAHELEVESSGRISATRSVQTDAQGQVTSEFRQAFGTLQVYGLGAVPSSVFDLSAQGQGACHE